MPKNKLAQLLLESDHVETDSGTGISKFGIEQIQNIHEIIQAGLANYDSRFAKNLYDPLVEIAKLGITTDDENLAFKCHAKLADHKYPQIKGIELHSKEDREVKLTIEIAGYAQADPTLVVEAEDIEVEEGDEDANDKYDYLTQTLSKDKDLG